MNSYSINGNNFTTYGISVMEQTGLNDPLEMKDRTTVDNASQHGILMDRNGIRFKERTISLSLQCCDTSLSIKSAEAKFAQFMEQFYGTAPARLEVSYDGGTMRYYDVDMLSWGDTTYYNRFFTKDIKLVETAPVKRVYSVTGTSATFTTAASVSGQTQQPVLISWGDGTFTSGRAATHTHTYSASGTYVIIISGVVSEVTVTTDHTLLYSVLR